MRMGRLSHCHPESEARVLADPLFAWVSSRAKARFTILAPRSAPAPCAGFESAAEVRGREGGRYKSSRCASICGDRLRGHEIRPPPFPRAKRGAKIVKRAFARMPAAGAAGPLSY